MALVLVPTYRERTFRFDSIENKINMLGAAVEAFGHPDKESYSMTLLLDRPIREENWRKEAGERNGTSTAPARLHAVNGEQQTVADAGPWEPAVQKMVSFQHLGDDWDGQGARAPSKEVLQSAIGLAYTLYQQGVGPPSRVVPGLEDSVIFEWQDPDGTYTEVEVVGWLVAEVMLIEPGQPAKHWMLPNEKQPSVAK